MVISQSIQQPIPKLRIRTFTNVSTNYYKFYKSCLVILNWFFNQKQSNWLKKTHENSEFVVSKLVVGSGDQDIID